MSNYSSLKANSIMIKKQVMGGVFIAFIWVFQSLGFLIDIFSMTMGIISSILLYTYFKNWKISPILAFVTYLVLSILNFISFSLLYSLQTIPFYLLFPTLIYIFEGKGKQERVVNLFILNLVYAPLLAIYIKNFLMEILFPGYLILLRAVGEIKFNLFFILSIFIFCSLYILLIKMGYKFSRTFLKKYYTKRKEN